MRRFISLILWGLCSLPVYVWGQTTSNTTPPPVAPERWSESLWNKFEFEMDQQGVQLSEAIFRSIDNIDVFNWSSNVHELGFGVSRNVYENNDYLQSWTVVDRWKIRYQQDIFNWALPVPAGVPLSLSFGIGAGASTEWVSIKQITHLQSQLLPLNEDSLEQLVQAPSATTFLHDDNQTRWWEYSPSARANILHLNNLLFLPANLPISFKRIQKMNVGEIISYNGTGYIDAGGSLGFVPFDFASGTHQPGISARAYLQGEFRITVLKESAKRVKLKVTRASTKGFSYGAGISSPDIGIFKGFLLFEGGDIETRILKTKLGIIPFSVNVDDSRRHMFEIGYSYDLAEPLAVDALMKALIGQLSHSYLLLDATNSRGEKFVKRLFTKSSNTRTRTLNQRIKVGFLFDKTRSRSTSSDKIVMAIPGEEPQVIYQETFTGTNKTSVVTGHNQRSNFYAEVSLDENCMRKVWVSKCIQLLTDYDLQNSVTTYKGLKGDVDYVESVLETEGVFPPIVKYITKKNDDDEEKKRKKVFYGKSRFRLGHVLDEKDIDTFLQIPDDKKWRLLAKAYGEDEEAWTTLLKRQAYRLKKIPQGILAGLAHAANTDYKPGQKLVHAMRLFKRWVKASKFVGSSLEEKREKVKALRVVFTDRMFARESLLLVSSAIETPVYTFLDAANSSFGKIQLRGKLDSDVQHKLIRYGKLVDFEALQARSNIDERLQITQYKWDEDQKEFTMEFERKPLVVLFTLARSSGWKKKKIMGRLLHYNTSYFDGITKIKLADWATDPVFADFAAQLKVGNYYNLSVSFSEDGKNWGETRTVRFHLEKPRRNQDDEDEDRN